MDFSLFLTGMLILAFIILPIFFYLRAQKKRREKLLNHFIELAEKHQAKVAESDIWNSNNCIGIDYASGKLFSLRIIEDQETTTLIDLNEVDKCLVTPMNKKGRDNSNERLDIIFKFKNSSLTDKTINFYNVNDSSIITDELKLAEKWANKVNGYLQKK